MKKLSLCLAISLAIILTSFAGLCGPAFAVIGTIDDVPAATLLLPYFEVDIENAEGVNTLFSINNASATAVLTHLVVWSDQSVPVLDFDVYLTGYDVQTISLRDIFVHGNVPVTATAGQDTTDDTISPQGPVSQDINLASCSVMPYPPGFVSASFRSHLQAWLQGLPSTAPGLGNQCAGSKTRDGILRGYITVDTVNTCNLFFPGDWDLYATKITNQNVLWGDYFYVDDAGNHAQGETLVHIEACPTCFVPGDHTFYGRYNGATAADAREPLPTTTAARFINGGTIFGSGTDFLIWREANSSDTSYACTNPGPPSWYPLEAVQIVVFDEQEQPVTATVCPSGDPTCEQEILIPNEVNRIDVANDLLTPFDFGWVYLNLQHNNPGFTGIYGDSFAQSWTTAVMTAGGRFSVGFDAIQLDNANTPNTNLILLP